MPRFVILLLSLLLAVPPSPAETMRVTAVTAPGTPWHDSWIYLETELATQPGLFEPMFYLGGQLGSEESALSQLRRGRVQMGGFSLQGASSVVPELGMLMSPYLFSSLAEVDYVMDRHMLAAFDELFAEKGLVLLAWAEVGWTSVYGSQPFRRPADVRGHKLRSSNALASQLFVRSIGADMVPLTFADIMPSLQTGLIQGGESGAIFYALTGLPGEAPYLTLTRHAFDTGMYLANRAWFESLSDSAREHLRNSIMPTAQFRKLVRSYAQRILADPDSYGIELIHPDPDEMEAWKLATTANRAQLAATIGGDSKRINALLDRAHQQFREIADSNSDAGL